jgi:phosphoenolpyruvate synthase/pyruvate phosphate dikinase
VLKLARWAVAIEKHYRTPMDIEWAKDGDLNELFIVQARPETVQSQKEGESLKTYTLEEKGKRDYHGSWRKNLPRGYSKQGIGYSRHCRHRRSYRHPER